MFAYLFYGYLEKSNDKFLKFYITLKKALPYCDPYRPVHP